MTIIVHINLLVGTMENTEQPADEILRGVIPALDAIPTLESPENKTPHLFMIVVWDIKQGI